MNKRTEEQKWIVRGGFPREKREEPKNRGSNGTRRSLVLTVISVAVLPAHTRSI